MDGWCFLRSSAQPGPCGSPGDSDDRHHRRRYELPAVAQFFQESTCAREYSDTCGTQYWPRQTARCREGHNTTGAYEGIGAAETGCYCQKEDACGSRSKPPCGTGRTEVSCRDSDSV